MAQLKNGCKKINRTSKSLAIFAAVLFGIVSLIPSQKQLAVIVGAQMIYDSKALNELNQATGVGAEYIKELLKSELLELKLENLKRTAEDKNG